MDKRSYQNWFEMILNKDRREKSQNLDKMKVCVKSWTDRPKKRYKSK